MRQNKNLPDLRPEMKEITLEHCSVLMERLSYTLGELYPEGPDEFTYIVDQLDVRHMQRDLGILFTVPAFERLFSTPFGKGVITGAFIQAYIFEEIDRD